MLLAVCVLCRPDGSHVWTTVVTWPSPGTKLYSVLAYVRYAPQGRQLLGTTCYFLSDVCKTDAIWGQEYLPFGNFAISIHSWPICLSTPALDRRLHLVPLVLWLCSFQLWCIVETIPCYLLQRIDRHCQTVPPVNAWSTGNAVALSLPSSLQIGHTSFIPDTTSIDVCLQSLS